MALSRRPMRPRSVWESVRSEGEEVRRIVSNIAAGDIEAAKCFYHDMLGLDVMMDLGWSRPADRASR